MTKTQEKLGAAAFASPESYTEQLDHELKDGLVCVFSDMHVDPAAPPSTAFRAIKLLIAELQPAVLIANGDTLDFSSVSGHSRILFEKRPSVADEIACGQGRLARLAG